MRNAFELLVACGALWVSFVYPFALVLRDQPFESTVVKSWAVQIAYFGGLCFGVPIIGSLILGPEAERELVGWVPDARVFGAILASGWLTPALAGLIAQYFRRRAGQRSE